MCPKVVDDAWAASLGLGSFFRAVGEEVDDLFDSGGAFFGATFRGVDVTEVGGSVELSDRVEERACWRVVGEGRGDVVGEVAVLWALGFEHHAGDLSAVDVSVTPPRRSEHEPSARFEWFDDAADVAAVDRAADVMCWLVSPDGVGSKGIGRNTRRPTVTRVAVYRC